MQRARDIGHRGLNLARQIRTFPLELSSYVVRSLCDQLLEHMSRNFLPKAELLGKDRIALGPFDHVQKAEIREASAIVRRNRVHYFPIAARHKLVRHHGGNGTSFGDRQKVRLAFGSSIGN